MNPPRRQPEQPLSANAYAIMAFVAGAIGIGLLILYVYSVPRLVAGGITNQVFYLLLVPWGLSAALCLFGAMRSYARFSHRQVGHALELGGPVVLFCLVVVGGFKLVPRVDTFDLTVRPVIPSEGQALVTAGSIMLDLENDRRVEPINSKGEANFKAIPQKFWGASVRILPRVDGYEERPYPARLESHVIELALHEAHPVVFLTGTVIPPPGPTAVVTVSVDGGRGEGRTDALGRFTFRVQGKAGDRIRLKVYVGESLAYDDFQTLPGPVTIPISSRKR